MNLIAFLQNLGTHNKNLTLISALFCFFTYNSYANNFLNQLDLLNYIHLCSPHVADNTMLAIVKTESKGNYLDLALNHGVHLAHQASNLRQATAWAKYLEKHQYNFDIGLAQVNIVNVHKYGYHATDALNPCINLKIAQAVLAKNYNTALINESNKHSALLRAISAYNTGNNISGFYNGYVNKVVSNAIISATATASKKQ